MRSYLFIVFVLILFACEKKEVNPQNDPITKVDPPAKASNMINRGPVYSPINSFTNTGISNKLFPGTYFTLEKASQNKFAINQRNLYDADFRFWDPSKCYLDYNQDGLLDMFAFLTNFVNPPFGSNFGKIMLVSDVFGTNPQIKVTDANRKFLPRLKTIDLNKDGVYEILFAAEEDHVLLNGGHGTPAPIQLAFISKSGEITYQQIGEPVSIHGQAFGDVDNDGDIDILVWRNAYTKPSNEDLPSMPILYLNNGANNFVMANSFTQFSGLADLLPLQSNGKRKFYAASTVDLFDIDGDGNLDMICSNSHNQPISIWEYNHLSTRIYWGNGTGFFDFQRQFTDLSTAYLQGLNIANNISVSPLGFTFFDYDKDGDSDIITSITPNYGGYIIQLCENLGSRQFKDVTKEKFDVYSSVFVPNAPSLGAFPNFYEPRVFDKDGDGDFDIVPDKVAIWDIWQFPISSNMYWENVGGSFRIKR